MRRVEHKLTRSGVHLNNRLQPVIRQLEGYDGLLVIGVGQHPLKLIEFLLGDVLLQTAE